MKHLKTYKIFEATYYEDDLNVDITSTISDIFEDLTDDSDFDVTCFTIGYTTLKHFGATFTDNDIHFSISREYYKHDKEGIGKTFTLNQVLPYLKRTFEFIESEGRFVSEIHYQYRESKSKRYAGSVKKVNLDTTDELLNPGELGGNMPIEYLGMTFVLNSKKKVNEWFFQVKDNSLENDKEIREYIHDLFSESESNGVRVFFYRRGSNPTRYSIKIGEYSDQVKFKYNDVSDEIDHLKSYLINEYNMRLSDVEIDSSKTVKVNGMWSGENVFEYGKRLEGWEKLNILKEKDTELLSMSISFVSRGGTQI